MKFLLSVGQLTAVSDLFLSISKAMYIAAFVAPAIPTFTTIFNSLMALVNGTVFAYLALLTIKRKEEYI